MYPHVVICSALLYQCVKLSSISRRCGGDYQQLIGKVCLWVCLILHRAVVPKLCPVDPKGSAGTFL